MAKKKQSKQLKKWQANVRKKRETPTDSVKMSEVILKLADPLLKKYGDDDNRVKTIISLTILEWNRLMFPDEKQEKIQKMMFDHFVPADGSAEQIGAIAYISELIKERKNRYYPNLKRVISKYDLNVSRGNITLNVSFAPIIKKEPENTDQ